MYDKFRVICCENRQKYPGKLFIDIYPADYVTHELLYQMRLKITPDVYDITGGVYLDDLGDGQVRLQYIKHYDKRLQRQQDALRVRLDPMIKELFSEMKKRGLTSTVRASLNEAYEVFGLRDINNSPKSARETELLQKQQRRQKAEELKKIRTAYYARQKFASAPHLRLMIRQLERSGD